MYTASHFNILYRIVRAFPIILIYNKCTFELKLPELDVSNHVVWLGRPCAAPRHGQTRTKNSPCVWFQPRVLQTDTRTPARRMHTTNHNTHSRQNTSGVCLCRELVGQRTVFVVFVQCCNSTKKRKEKGGYVCLVAKDQASLFSCSVNQNNKNKSARAAEQTKLKTQDSSCL